MPIPDFQTITIPLLQFCADQKEHGFREVIEGLVVHFALTEEEQRELLPSGKQTRFENRVYWAKIYLSRAGLLDTPSRGRFIITERGLTCLAEHPQTINIEYLKQFEEFNSFRKRSGNTNQKEADNEDSRNQDVTPTESLEYAYLQIRHDLNREILTRLKKGSPSFFENVVVEVLVAMGYGGSRKDAGETVGRSGDGGIDGIIKEDRLGLDVIYIQAKRWDNTVGRPEVQKFVGALQGHRARKGVFITTSEFSKEAEEYAKLLDSKVILIDGQKLADYMIDFDVGVSKVASYDVKRIDSDYFEEEQIPG